MIVQHKITPFTTAPIARGMPLMTIHKILARNDIVPPPYWISFPKGKNAREANLKHCRPIGIPTIVIHHRIPQNTQESPCHNPQHKNQIIFPKQPILYPFLQPLVFENTFVSSFLPLFTLVRYCHISIFPHQSYTSNCLLGPPHTGHLSGAVSPSITYPQMGHT